MIRLILPALVAGFLVSGCARTADFFVPTTEEDKAQRQAELAAACLAAEEALTEASLRQDMLPERNWALIQGYERRTEMRCQRDATVVTGADVLAVSVYAAQISRLMVDGLRD